MEMIRHEHTQSAEGHHTSLRKASMLSPVCRATCWIEGSASMTELYNLGRTPGQEDSRLFQKTVPTQVKEVRAKIREIFNIRAKESPASRHGVTDEGS